MDTRTKKMDRIMQLIFEERNPGSIRAIAKRTGLSKSTVLSKLKELRKEGMIKADNSFSGTDYARHVKSAFFVHALHKSGLVEFLAEKYGASSIILFGSVAKGESVKKSDIDIFVESPKKIKVELKIFENKLNHEIQLFVEADIKKLPKNLFNNVVNGIKLYGYFDAK